MMYSLHLATTTVLLLALASSVKSNCFPKDSLSFQHAPVVAEGLKTRLIANKLESPRGIVFDESGTLLVVERGIGITALTPRDTTSCSGWQRKIVISNGDLNHGIEYRLGKLYASTSNEVYRWSYNAATQQVTSQAVVLVTGMENSDHTTRTLLLAPSNKMAAPTSIIINRGSGDNLDYGSIKKSTGRAQIRSFPVLGKTNGSVKSWNSGRLLAWGVRNGVGLALGADGDLWEVENSADSLQWRGKDVSKDNPAEELNRIPLASNPKAVGQWYGYPYCFTVYQPFGSFGTGGQFSQKSGYSDAKCARGNNTRPRLTFQAHSAPLDIKFYDASGAGGAESPYAINAMWDKDAFVSFHGSFNRNPPTGYGVVRVPWNGDEPKAPQNAKFPAGSYEFLVHAKDLTKCPDQCIRPVGLAFDQASGRLFVSSDATGEIFIIQSASSPNNLP